jgi:DNA polymerase III alpha subunit
VEGCAKPPATSPASKAEKIFDNIEKFAGYGFNKSHSAAYAVVGVADRLPEGALSRSSSWPPT